MSDTRYRDLPEDRWGESSGPLGGQTQQAVIPQPMPLAVPVGGANSALDLAQAGIVTAQRVAVKRNVAAIRQEAIVAAQEAGDGFFYRIPFKDNRKGTTTYVEGPTIQCAMAAANIYGNCRVEAFLLNETPDAFQFMARFTDLEKGVTITRAFRQRRGMDTGMRDNERRMEGIFSIGQSKAMRNVTVAALGWLTDLMETEAKRGILAKIENNMDGARRRIVSICAEMGIPVARVERSLARTVAAWLAPDMARILSQLASVRDGFASPDDLFPDPEAEDRGAALQQAQQTAAGWSPAGSQRQADEAAGERAPTGQDVGTRRPRGRPRADAGQPQEQPTEPGRPGGGGDGGRDAGIPPEGDGARPSANGPLPAAALQQDSAPTVRTGGAAEGGARDAGEAGTLRRPADAPRAADTSRPGRLSDGPADDLLGGASFE